VKAKTIMDKSSVASNLHAFKGAIARANHLPEAQRNNFDPSAAAWDHDGVWLGDWGKSEPGDILSLPKEAEPE